MEMQQELHYLRNLLRFHFNTLTPLGIYNFIPQGYTNKQGYTGPENYHGPHVYDWYCAYLKRELEELKEELATKEKEKLEKTYSDLVILEDDILSLQMGIEDVEMEIKRVDGWLFDIEECKKLHHQR